MPIVRGRDFDARDSLQAPPVAIVNETFVKKTLGGADPIGRVLRLETPPGEPAQTWRDRRREPRRQAHRSRDDFEPLVDPAGTQARRGDWHVRDQAARRASMVMPAVVQRIAE